jgi:hypothetical protein
MNNDNKQAIEKALRFYEKTQGYGKKYRENHKRQEAILKEFYLKWNGKKIGNVTIG